MSNNATIRKFIRHPANVPIEVRLDWVAEDYHPDTGLNNVGVGGLSFRSPRGLPVGQQVQIRFPWLEDARPLSGKVVWNRKQDEAFEIGVEFADRDQRYRLRMIEQVCHIQHFRNEVKERQGRDLTMEQAAEEWITQYAFDFPGN